jgi:hypothetical protein
LLREPWESCIRTGPSISAGFLVKVPDDAVVEWVASEFMGKEGESPPLDNVNGVSLVTFDDANPWEVFCLASHLDEVKLAQRAVGVMHQDRTLHPTVIAAPCNGSHYQYVSPLHKITRAYFI